ncbi:MAG: hypothetical protein ABR499_07820 [Gemmatimonadaceae bacterium]
MRRTSALVACATAVAAVSLAAWTRVATTPSEAADYSPVSPHWRHLRLHITDYRIQYQPRERRASEYEWVARHFDRILLDGGDRKSVPEYRRLNRSAEIYRYALNWTVLRPGEDKREDPSIAYYRQMVDWYARHREYALEDAFLHDRARCGPAGRKTEACRLTFKIWTQMRWAINPGDPGLRAFQRFRIAAIAADADGLFIDEHSSGDIRGKLEPGRMLEYADWSSYERDMVTLLGELRASVGPRKRLMVNTHTYLTPFDSQMAVAAGGAHLEDFNSPFFAEMEKRWRFAESLIAAGAALTVSPVEPDATPREYTAGNSASPLHRRRLWELASFYLVAPRQVGLVAFSSGAKWKWPFPDQWWGAVATDVGRPTGARRVFAEGRDPTGRRYRVWAREYERALVLVRPVLDWGRPEFGDESAVQVRVPSGPRTRPLSADGRVGPQVTRIPLRVGEAAILVSERGTR